MKSKYYIGKKTLWEKEKLLDTSNVSFSHNVFHSYISFVCQNAVLCGSGLTHPYWGNLEINLNKFSKDICS